MEPSIFTQIINGEIPCHKVYEDDRVIAFLDIYPATTGHTLVVSKQQTDHLWNLDDDNYRAVFNVAKKLALPLKNTFNKDRTVLLVEGFDIAHAHVHLIPANSHAEATTKQDTNAEPDHNALAAVAASIKESL